MEKKRAWLLGVTSKIATARWPQEVELLTVERVQAMIDSVWPGNTDGCRRYGRTRRRYRFWTRVLVSRSVGCLRAVGYRDIAPVRQYQNIQPSFERATLRLAVERPLKATEEASLAEKLVEFLGHRFVVDFDYRRPDIPRGLGGKFEDFICGIKTGDSVGRDNAPGISRYRSVSGNAAGNCRGACARPWQNALAAWPCSCLWTH